MALPWHKVAPLTQNLRVKSFPVGGDESRRSTPLDLGRSVATTEVSIDQGYRQIFFQAFKVDRDPALESQLRSGQITVKDFLRSLLLSQKFRDNFHRCNSNSRIVDQIATAGSTGQAVIQIVRLKEEIIIKHGLPMGWI